MSRLFLLFLWGTLKEIHCVETENGEFLIGSSFVSQNGPIKTLWMVKTLYDRGLPMDDEKVNNITICIREVV